MHMKPIKSSTKDTTNKIGQQNELRRIRIKLISSQERAQYSIPSYGFLLP